jgi:hypothetical protein
LVEPVVPGPAASVVVGAAMVVVVCAVESVDPPTSNVQAVKPKPAPITSPRATTISSSGRHIFRNAWSNTRAGPVSFGSALIIFILDSSRRTSKQCAFYPQSP